MANQNPYSTEALRSAEGAFLVTPHDENLLPERARGLSFAGAGALALVLENGDEITVPSGALAPGVIHPVSVVQVKATGTTATGIVGWGD